jgi:hypothetical protein
MRHAVAVWNRATDRPFGASGEGVWVEKMSGPPESRVGEYRAQAAKLRFLAYQTEYPGGRHQLLMLANSFDKLADRVEARGTALATAAD